MAEELIIKIGGDASRFADELEKVQKKTKDLEKGLTTLARNSAIAFTILSAAITGTVVAFAKFEEGLTGVDKTTNFTRAGLKQFGDEINKLAFRIPIAQTELLKFAEAGGQLGVAEKDLLKFTETMAKLARTTDIVGEDGARAIVRILTVTGEGAGVVDKFGAALVALGNNFAATEAEILRATNEIARGISQFGVSAEQSLALGTTIRALGIRSEAAGTVVTKAFLEIRDAIDNGGNSLRTLSKLTKLNRKELKEAFGDDAVAVFKLFIEGLGEVQKEGGNVNNVLEQMNLKGARVAKVLPVLAQRSEILKDALKLSAEAFKENTALQEEFAKFAITLTARFQILKNSIFAVAIEIGENLAPAVRLVLDAMIGLFNLIKNNRALTVLATAYAVAALALTGLILVLSTGGLAVIKFRALLRSGLIPTLGALRKSIFTTAVAFRGLKLAIQGFLAATVIGLVLVAITELALAFKDRFQEIVATVQISFDLLKDLATVFAASFAAQLEPLGKIFEGIAKVVTGDISGGVKDFAIGVKDSVLSLTKVNASLAKALVASSPKVLAALKKLQERFAAIEAQRKAALIAASGAEKEDKKKGGKGGKDDEGLTVAERLTQAKLDLVRFETEERSKLIISSKRKEIDLLKQLEDEENADLRTALETRIALLRSNQEEIDADREVAVEKISETLALLRERGIEFQELSLAERQKFFAKNIELFQNQLDAEKAIKDSFIKAELKIEKERRDQLIRDRIQFGNTIAAINDFFRSAEVQGVKAGSAQLIALQQSRFSALKAIGKAAAVAQIIIATQESMSKALLAFSFFPPLGFAAAAAIGAFGAERIATTLGAQRGGVVPTLAGALPGRDSVPSLLTPGELVAPARNFDEVVNAVAAQRAQSLIDLEDRDVEPQEVMIGFEGFEAGKFLTATQNEERALGTSQEF